MKFIHAGLDVVPAMIISSHATVDLVPFLFAKTYLGSSCVYQSLDNRGDFPNSIWKSLFLSSLENITDLFSRIILFAVVLKLLNLESEVTLLFNQLPDQDAIHYLLSDILDHNLTLFSVTCGDPSTRLTARK